MSCRCEEDALSDEAISQHNAIASGKEQDRPRNDIKRKPHASTSIPSRP